VTSSKVWFITGASRGFGRVWTDAALRRGDQVAATARKLESIADLQEKYGDNVLTLELEVTNHAQVKAAVEQAYAHFGRSVASRKGTVASRFFCPTDTNISAAVILLTNAWVNVLTELKERQA
jgi:NAD(P)-dependent dehydrogenase (short-subunit alcohol dehydrogenase family)